jgi:multiple sugar transport system permease protein
VLVTQFIVGETQQIGLGSTFGVILLVIALVPITIFLVNHLRREEKR